MKTFNLAQIAAVTGFLGFVVLTPVAFAHGGAAPDGPTLQRAAEPVNVPADVAAQNTTDARTDRAANVQGATNAGDTAAKAPQTAQRTTRKPFRVTVY